jgi:hypothetical protein
LIYDRVIWPEKYDPKTSAIYALNDMEAAGRRRELVERANFFEQRATEYLKATKSRRLGLTAYGRRSKRGETPDRAADLRVA